jgi:stage III sporulation protein AA
MISQAEEFRLRMGRPMTVVFPEGESHPQGCPVRPVTGEDLSTVLEIASQCSIHTVLERFKSGFITVAGGHRIGICGSGVVKDGGILNLRQLSSVAVRIAKEARGSASEVLLHLYDGGSLQNTLIISPPGRGKTTLLRDLIRCISDGEGVPPLRVGVSDERGELAAMENGMPRMEIGARTDVMDGCPMQTGLLMLLRGMNPQVLAMDEITAPEDLEALETAAGCGVRLLATAHGENQRELRQRPLYRKLLDEGIFRRTVIISMDGNKRRYEVFPLEVLTC